MILHKHFKRIFKNGNIKMVTLATPLLINRLCAAEHLSSVTLKTGTVLTSLDCCEH